MGIRKVTRSVKVITCDDCGHEVDSGYRVCIECETVYCYYHKDLIKAYFYDVSRSYGLCAHCQNHLNPSRGKLYMALDKCAKWEEHEEEVMQGLREERQARSNKARELLIKEGFIDG